MIRRQRHFERPISDSGWEPSVHSLADVEVALRRRKDPKSPSVEEMVGFLRGVASGRYSRHFPKHPSRHEVAMEDIAGAMGLVRIFGSAIDLTETGRSILREGGP